MGYNIAKLDHHPILLVQLGGDIGREDIRAVLLGSIEHFQRMSGVACLLFDLERVTAIDTERFVHGLHVFERTSPTFKSDAPILLAFAGANGITGQINTLLESKGMAVPSFKSVPAALTYLELKVDNTNVSQSLTHEDTDEIETMHFNSSQLHQPKADHTAEAGSETFPTSGLLRVKHIETERSVIVIPNQETLVGRRCKGEAKPDIDLSMWGAYHYGVSRRHALIIRQSNTLGFVDLDSANGTFVNGTRLQPQTEAVLRDGDQIHFGRLAVRIYFEDTLQGGWNDSQEQ